MGINICGYINSEFGLGEAVRALIHAIDAAGIPYVLNNFTANKHRKKDTSFHHFTRENPYPINLILVNPDMLDTLIMEYGTEYFQGKYTIGYWFWELSDLPNKWLKYFDFFHEIWTGSRYCLDAIATVSNIPVVRIPPAMHPEPVNTSPAFLRHMTNRTVFLYIFDFYSTFQRKNPDKVIRAFLQNFSGRSDVMLVIKYTNADIDGANARLLNRMTDGHENIHIINGYLQRNDMAALLKRADCYVSLHAAEGFGLTIAEAMMLGKPVIATGYSANMDFMTVNNSFPVRYTLTEIQKSDGAYLKGQVWADPDEAHCAALMKHVADNPKEAARIGSRAKSDIAVLFNKHAIGRRIKTRISRISEFTNHFDTIINTPSHQLDLIQAYEALLVSQKKQDMLKRIVRWFMRKTGLQM